jgi:uncharacterized protein YidB (DUF937 family)
MYRNVKYRIGRSWLAKSNYREDAMGFLDDVLGSAKEAIGAGGAGQTNLVNSVLGLFSGGGSGGGFLGIVQSLRDKGLGEIVSSWIGTGRNLPVTAEQLRNGLGPELIGQLASKAGLPPNIAEAKLAEILPVLIDKLTPEGKIPEPGILQEGVNLLRGKLPKG